MMQLLRLANVGTHKRLGDRRNGQNMRHRSLGLGTRVKGYVGLYGFCRQTKVSILLLLTKKSSKLYKLFRLQGKLCS